MQLLPIEVVLDLHPPESKVCAIKFFHSRRLSCFLCHCSHSSLTLSFDTNCRELNKIPRFVRCKNKEKNKNNYTRQYLRGSAIYLCSQNCRDFTVLKEKYKIQQYSFLSKKQHKTLISKTTVLYSVLMIHNGLQNERYNLGLLA